MTRNAKWLVVNASALLLTLGGFTAPSFADTASDQWQFDTLVYAYLPQLSRSGSLDSGQCDAYAHFDSKTTVWTLAGSYRAVVLPEATLDPVVRACARFLSQHLNWQ